MSPAKQVLFLRCDCYLLLIILIDDVHQFLNDINS